MYIKIIRGRDDETRNYIMTKIFRAVLPLLAPFCPFIAEYIYDDLFNDSVHLAGWPIVEKDKIREDLEKDMLVVDSLVSACNAVRQDKSIKLRWPLKSVATDVKIANEEMVELIKMLANVQEVIFDKKVVKDKNKTDFEHGSFILSEEVDKKEALVRELLRAIQAERKRLSLNVKDSISLKIETDSKYVKVNEKRIAEHVGAFEILFGKADEMGSVKVDEEEIKFSFKKV